jgi:hypothetical protein
VCVTNRQFWCSEKVRISRIPYTLVVGSLMYTMLCIRPDICFAIGLVSTNQSNLGEVHWHDVKNILKSIKRIRDYMLVYRVDDLVPIGYIDLNFQANKDKRKYISRYVLPCLEGLFHGEVSINFVLLIPPWKFCMWQFRRHLKTQSESGNSF